MKKILCVIPALNSGGAERVIATLANEWCINNDITILTFNDGRSFYSIDDKVRIIGLNETLPKSGIRRHILIPAVEIRRLLGIFKEIKRNDYDFVMSFTNVPNILCSIISKLLPDKNIVVSERSMPYSYPKYIQKLLLWLYRWDAAVICQSEKARDFYKKNVKKERLIVLPNPVNIPELSRIPSEIKEKTIVSVGRLIEVKNHRLLIEAFHDICGEYPDYRLVIYGKGPLKHELENLIIRKHLEDKVILGGEIKNVADVITKCSFFVLPSDYEGFPNALVEAMGCSLPVITSDFNSDIVRSLIKSGDNGYVFRRGDKVDLVEKMRCLLEREEEFEAIGANNRKIAKLYDSDTIAKLWLDKIFDVL